MNVQIDIDLVAIASMFILGIIAFVRVQSKQAAQEKEIIRIEADYKKSIEDQKNAHEKSIAAIKETHSESSRALWDKLETISHTMIEAVKGISRLEGRRESEKQ